MPSIHATAMTTKRHGKLFKRRKKFEQALFLIRKNKLKKEAASVLISQANLLRKKGQWNRAYDVLQESKNLRISIKDSFGINSCQIELIDLLIDQSKYTQATKEVNFQIQASANSNDKPFIQDLKIKQVYMLSFEEKYEDMIDELIALDPDKNNQQINKIIFDSSVAIGEKQSLENWLKSNTEMATTGTNIDKYEYLKATISINNENTEMRLSALKKHG